MNILGAQEARKTLDSQFQAEEMQWIVPTKNARFSSNSKNNLRRKKI